MGSFQNVLLMILAAFILTQTLVAIYADDISYNGCYVDRYTSEIANVIQSQALSSGTLTVFMNIICLSVIAISSVSLDFKKRLARIGFNNVFGVACQVQWMVSTYHVVLFLKKYLGDDNCSLHGNSLSGHFSYHTTVLMALPFHVVRSRRNPNVLSNYISLDLTRKFFTLKLGKKGYIFVWSFVMTLLLSIIVLSRTYFLGYHSLKQILYGVSYAMAMEIFFMFFFSNHRREYNRWVIQFVLISMATFVSNVLLIRTDIRLSVVASFIKLLLYIMLIPLIYLGKLQDISMKRKF